jgi:hypothetical protein
MVTSKILAKLEVLSRHMPEWDKENHQNIIKKNIVFYRR